MSTSAILIYLAKIFLVRKGSGFDLIFDFDFKADLKSFKTLNWEVAHNEVPSENWKLVKTSGQNYSNGQWWLASLKWGFSLKNDPKLALREPSDWQEILAVTANSDLFASLGGGMLNQSKLGAFFEGAISWRKVKLEAFQGKFISGSIVAYLLFMKG